jgi:hypothetical protein
MRTTVIPAQITTVEDKIAGNLNLTQIILLLGSLFVATFIYATFPEKLHFSIYKVILIAVQFLVFSVLALRVKGKIVLNWLFILSSYHFRPRYYIYSKNDAYLRLIDLPPAPAKKAVKTQKAAAKKPVRDAISIADLEKLETLLRGHRERLSFRFDKNGGMNAVWQIKN